MEATIENNSEESDIANVFPPNSNWTTNNQNNGSNSTLLFIAVSLINCFIIFNPFKSHSWIRASCFPRIFRLGTLGRKVQMSINLNLMLIFLRKHQRIPNLINMSVRWIQIWVQRQDIHQFIPIQLIMVIIILSSSYKMVLIH